MTICITWSKTLLPTECIFQNLIIKACNYDFFPLCRVHSIHKYSSTSSGLNCYWHDSWLAFVLKWCEVATCLVLLFSGTLLPLNSHSIILVAWHLHHNWKENENELMSSQGSTYMMFLFPSSNLLLFRWSVSQPFYCLSFKCRSLPSSFCVAIITSAGY